MRAVVSREQARAYDRYATEQAEVPSLLLMENAGRGATERLLTIRHGDPGQVVILAGPGNNGGDGFVLGRRLALLGHSVEVWLVGDPGRLVGDALSMWKAYLGVGGKSHRVAEPSDLPQLTTRLASATTIVDALFGTGLGRPIEGLYAQVIELMQESPAFIYALDIASGLDANRGRILGVAVRAHATVTFGQEKLGHFTSEGIDCSGHVEVVDIGVPRELCSRTGYTAERLDATDLAPRLLGRRPSSHKGRAGRVAVLAGHAGTTGAAILAARGALRMGAGLVTHVGLPETMAALDLRVLEAMTKRLDTERLEQSLADALSGTNALIVGPGLGTGDLERRMVTYVVKQATIPVVLDADALTLLADDPTVLQQAPAPRILLPHRGELARLLRSTTADVEDDPYAALSRIVELTEATVVLKGAYSFVGAPNKKAAIVGTPCPALGTGGSGDVLSGIVGALAVDHAALDAALLGVHLHGRSAILWTELRSQPVACVAPSHVQGLDRGLLASDVADNLPAAIAELSRAKRPMTV